MQPYFCFFTTDSNVSPLGVTNLGSFFFFFQERINSYQCVNHGIKGTYTYSTMTTQYGNIPLSSFGKGQLTFWYPFGIAGLIFAVKKKMQPILRDYHILIRALWLMKSDASQGKFCSRVCNASCQGQSLYRPCHMHFYQLPSICIVFYMCKKVEIKWNDNEWRGKMGFCRDPIHLPMHLTLSSVSKKRGVGWEYSTEWLSQFVFSRI